MGKPDTEWEGITKNLLAAFPLSKEQLVDAVLDAWREIFASRIGKFRIGKEIHPQPQILGFLLHELVPLLIEKHNPDSWCRDRTGHEKDLVCLTNSDLSMEIKTSSSSKGIAGNRSYAQVETNAKKTKSGYYLLINFDKTMKGQSRHPSIKLIRFAWLSHSHWKGQDAPTGQAASLSANARTKKMITIYPAPKSAG